jgi:proteasome assembly chaperone (PAC2) family protein
MKSNNMKLKLKRDHVISIVKGKDLVGVYVKYPHFIIDDDGTSHTYSDEVLLAEMSPKKADKIIKLWNTK